MATMQQSTSTLPTESQSLLMLKNLLRTTLSSITYLRDIFPEEAYDDRKLEGINLKLLKKNNSNESDMFIDWLEKGCFDALGKKYLESMILGISLDPNEPEKTIETYTFQFSYAPDDQSKDSASQGRQASNQLRLLQNDREVARAHSKEGIRKATVQMLRRLLTVTQTLQPLPDDRFLIIRLYFYDDITPPDYQPECFKDVTGMLPLAIEGETKGFKFGGVDTPSHSMQMDMKIAKNMLEDIEDDEPEPVCKAEATPQLEMAATPNIAQVMQEATGEKTNRAKTPSFRTAHKNLNAVPGSASLDSENKENDNTVQCVCGVNQEDGTMVCCQECGTWQHIVCYGFLDEENLPRVHFCDLCARKLTTQCDVRMRELHDTGLLAMSPIKAKWAALYRRALYAVKNHEEDTIASEDLGNLLGLETQMAVVRQLFARLAKNGYLKRGKKARGPYTIVRTQLTSADFFRAFGSDLAEHTEEGAIIKEASRATSVDDVPGEQELVKRGPLDDEGTELLSEEAIVTRSKKQRTSTTGQLKM